jgi:hypothetical protein
MSERAPESVLWALLRGAMTTRTVAVVSELRVADALADRPRPVEEVGREVGADPDTLHRPGNDPHGAKWLDVLMLTLLSGQERDEEQWRALLGDAGFEPVCIKDDLIEARCR